MNILNGTASGKSPTRFPAAPGRDLDVPVTRSLIAEVERQNKPEKKLAVRRQNDTTRRVECGQLALIPLEIMNTRPEWKP